jgi:hypothetical protein
MMVHYGLNPHSTSVVTMLSYLDHVAELADFLDQQGVA